MPSIPTSGIWGNPFPTTALKVASTVGRLFVLICVSWLRHHVADSLAICRSSVNSRFFFPAPWSNGRFIFLIHKAHFILRTSTLCPFISVVNTVSESIPCLLTLLTCSFCYGKTLKDYVVRFVFVFPLWLLISVASLEKLSHPKLKNLAIIFTCLLSWLL